MELTRRTFALSGLCAIGGFVLTNGAVPAFGQGRGNLLRYGTVTEVTNLDPHVYGGTAWKVLIGSIYSTLVTNDTNGNMVAGLAESWEQPDASTIIFKLRQGVKYHDGSDVVADDVLFSLERIKNEATGATLRNYLNDVSVKILDPQTIELKSVAPNVSLLSVLSLPEAAILSRAWVNSGVNIKANANGTGPFHLASYEPGVSAKLLKNDSYFHKDQPLLDGVDFRMIKSDDARVSALRGGTLDMIDFVPWKDIDVLGRMPNFKVDSASGGFMNIWFNASRSPWDNPLVRRAIAFAIDREAVSRAAFFGHGAPIYGAPTPEESPFYNADLKNSVSLDLEEAKKLLKEAGYAEGLSMELIVFQGLGVYTTTAQILQANLKQVGINVTIKLVEWSDLINRKNSGNYDAMLYGVSMKLNDPDAYSYYFGSTSTYWAKPIGYRDDVLEALLDEGRAETDLERRKLIYQKVEERLLETMPWIFINFREQAQAYLRKVSGYVHIPGALNESAAAICLPSMSFR
ncbi:ABC transporter substrate-binding protein [Brucella gallinifaecis]|uniref:Twin-arginine translocation pathway signal n=1 Tax=Brucella gallinifaecis TaxID=215590 RepID=A0A502BND4_9HYPH|nr:ABC transporter substrate-binding protein [Brucella gallinifaecis]TPF75380.1 twin-arginine translocation pathway signal [Brucella gallinifaecis]